MASDLTAINMAEKCGLDPDRWAKLKDDHNTILKIYNDYGTRFDELNSVAVSLSSFLQRMTGVHSVRWRIKSPEHLVAKICRKKEGGVEKYNDISVENYRDLVTDIIGIRVLHLLKGDFPDLHSAIMSTWEVSERPIVYLRDGDQQDLRDLYGELGLSVENHQDGYRSIHYIILTSFTKNAIKCELQVRTIFEEGWSEIDHKIRYPEASKEPLVLEFINIFNRLSGAADEMGTFVLKLSENIEDLKAESSKKEADAAAHYKALEDKIDELERANQKNGSLKQELSKLRLLAERARLPEKHSLSVRDVERDRRRYETMRIRDITTSEMAKFKNISIEDIERYGMSPSAFAEAASISNRAIAEAAARRSVTKERAESKPIKPRGAIRDREK